MGTTIVEVPVDQCVNQIEPERCCRGNLYVCEDVSRRQIMILAQKVANIQSALETLGWETPATSSLFDASANKHRKGKTGAWAVHRLTSDELPRFVAERRKHFARTVIAATNPQAWQLVAV